MKGSIYKITNDINDKVYVGKTLLSIEERFKEHKQDYQRARCEKRPLYNAMNKYGIEHFQISLIEECPIEILSEREKYWIKELGTYHNGYNATLGGDGTQYIDYSIFIEQYNQGLTCCKIAEINNCCVDTVYKGLKLAGIDTSVNRRQSRKRKVQALTLDRKVIKSFDSVQEAAQWLIDTNQTTSNNIHSISSVIDKAINGSRDGGYKMLWTVV